MRKALSITSEPREFTLPDLFAEAQRAKRKKSSGLVFEKEHPQPSTYVIDVKVVVRADKLSTVVNGPSWWRH